MAEVCTLNVFKVCIFNNLESVFADDGLGGVPDGFAFSLHMARQPIDDIVKVDD